jgi:hypothetical protein
MHIVCKATATPALVNSPEEEQYKGKYQILRYDHSNSAAEASRVHSKSSGNTRIALALVPIG